METPSDYVVMSEPEQDALAASIALAAHECARFFVRREAAPDLAQDVILFCLKRLRAGQWKTLRSPYVLPLVLALLRRRAVDLVRQHRRLRVRDRRYARTLQPCMPAWMSPELELEEGELAALHQRVLDTIPLASREAYELVHTQHATYEAVARRLSMSRLTVTSYVTQARRRFREQLLLYGIEAPKQQRMGTRRTTTAVHCNEVINEVIPVLHDDSFHGAQ